MARPSGFSMCGIPALSYEDAAHIFGVSPCHALWCMRRNARHWVVLSAGALRRAMRLFEPPLTALDVSLLTGTVAEGAVDDLLSGARRPSLAEIAAIAEALELPVGTLLANQRVSGGESDGR